MEKEHHHPLEEAHHHPLEEAHHHQEFHQSEAGHHAFAPHGGLAVHGFAARGGLHHQEPYEYHHLHDLQHNGQGDDGTGDHAGAKHEPAQSSTIRGRGKPIEELTRADLRSVRSLSISGSEDSAKQHHRALVAAAKFSLQEKVKEVVELEFNSVYTAAIVMPQFARSCGWPAQLTTFAIRSYFFLLLNVFLQCFLVHLLMKEEMVMDAFAGQMNLCDFGGASGCPNGPGCVGPGGTRITPSRLYTFDTWNTRKYVKEALLILFPDREKEINENVDPGEYGVESSHVRFVCTFIFVMGTLSDFYEAWGQVLILYHIPSCDESWMDYDDDEVILKIAGMPLHWKLFTFTFVVVPKLILWGFTLRTGVAFIMDTANIDDTIVNATALGFILTIDELMFETITAPQTRHMISVLEGFPIVSEDAGNTYAEIGKLEDTDELIERSEVKRWKFSVIYPRRLTFCILISAGLVAEYYWRKCEVGPDGGMVSVPMHAPKSTNFQFLSALLPYTFPVPKEEETYWTMPAESEI